MKSKRIPYYRQKGFKLFLLTLPFLVLIFLLNYLPLRGWIYAFYDYNIGVSLLKSAFVGLKYFTQLFDNAYDTSETLRVLKNTFGMSLLFLLTSPLSMVFAILLNELHSKKYKKVVQTLTTIPNFISWVLVYALAFAIFSVDGGFLNSVLLNLGIISTPLNVLALISSITL